VKFQELEVNYEVPNEEDHNGLIQFFADGDAWLNSNKPNNAMSAPSLVHNISVASDSSSGTASTGSVSSRSNIQPTTTRKKRSKANSANGSNRKLGRPSAFPQKLYTMLTSVPQQDAHLAHIVSFTPDGTAFEIYDSEAFVEAILPKYFKMSSFSSFQRQLQLYNFKRVSKGGAYRHPLFHRDQPDNLAKMGRKQSKPSTFVLSLSK
jgi:HSF-type DNA-binding